MTVGPTQASRSAVKSSFGTTIFGPFAGIFTLNQVVKTRMDAAQAMSFDWHVRYQYLPVPGNRLGRTDVGVDERIFYFRCQGTWTVRGVSDHMTADLR